MFMNVCGIRLQVGRTIAFEYARPTESGLSGRIGEIEKLDVANGTVTIREKVGTGHQFRAFKADAMRNLLAE